MVRYLIHGYEEKEIPPHTSAWEMIQGYFTEHDYNRLNPEQVFKQTQGNMTVYVYKYRTLYYETFIVEEREF